MVPDRVPISLRGLEGPQEPTKENNHEVEPSKKSPGNFGLNRESSGLNYPFGASRTRVHAHMRYIMCTPSGCTYGCPKGHPLEPGARRADERQKEKESRPIMGTPKGCPYACPTGACINGPTLRGAHCRSPKGSSKKKSDVRWGHPCEPTEQNNQANQPREHVRR